MKVKAGLFVFGALFYSILLCDFATAGVSIPSGLTYETIAEPGKVYQSIIRLRNSEKQPQEVKLYQTDYLFSSDGTSTYGDPGKAPRSNAGWIMFNPHRLVLPPGGTAAVNYTVRVPGDPGLIGTYWSMLMVESHSPAGSKISNPKEEKNKVSLAQILRYGVQMITQIGDTGISDLRFTRPKVSKTDGRRILQVNMENTGERWLRPSLWAMLYDDMGNEAGKFPGKGARLFPGTSTLCRIDLSRVQPGTYKALVVADCGEDRLFGVNYTLHIK